jgi:hypothetical protein
MSSISISKELSPTRLHHDTAHNITFCRINAVKIWKLIHVKVVCLTNDMYSMGVNTYGRNSTAGEWTTWHSRCLNIWEVELHSRIVKILLYILGYPLRIWYRGLVLTRFFVALLIRSTELLGKLKSHQIHVFLTHKSHVKNRRFPLWWRFQRGSTYSLAGQFLQSTWSLCGIYSILIFCSLFSFLDFNRISLPNLYK